MNTFTFTRNGEWKIHWHSPSGLSRYLIGEPTVFLLALLGPLAVERIEMTRNCLLKLLENISKAWEVLSPMTLRRRENEIISVRSTNPEGADDTSRSFGDFYHYLLTCSWPLLLLQLTAAFFLLNALFGLTYYAIGGIANARKGSFADVFFFSIETMTTIGYGRLIPVTLTAHILMSLEALSGLMGFALMTGIAFTKFSRPIVRVRFSRNAVISKRDGIPSLMFRLANTRANQIVEARVHALFARADVTLEGENVWRFSDLELSRYRNGTFRHSWTVIHPITPDSPLYGSSPESLERAFGEIVVSLTGIDGVFMQTVYARHSYLARDVIYGARLSDVMIREPQGGFAIDYRKFDNIDRTETPIWERQLA
jgi:inward rectifier potassium channel